MINLHEFKQAVLQKAMQGKLTKQLPSDGNASDLLDKIKQKKQSLINAGKLKKHKKLAPISKKEIPFKIPKNWEWAKLGNICLKNVSGNTPRKSDKSNWDPNGMPWLSVKDMKSLYVNNSKEHISHKGQIRATIVPPYSLIIVVRMSIGEFAINTKQLAINQDLRAFIFQHSLLPWMMYAYKFLNFHGHGATVKGITKKEILNSLIPLPPLPEQKRIVSKVDKCFALADTIQKERQLNQRFAKDMKQSLLKAAMKGKLTKQLPSDGNAEDLLKEIKQRKQQLVETGKIRKRKPLPPVNKKDVPFKIPKNWKWIKLGNISSYIQRGKSPKYANTGTLVLSQKCVRWDKVDISVAKHINNKSLPKYQKIRFLKPNDILINSTGTGTVGRASIVSSSIINKYGPLVVDGHVTIIRLNTIYSKYVWLFLLSNVFQNNISNITSGSTNQVELSKSAIVNVCIPLPPLSEQKRIVNKLDTLFNKISN